MYPLKCRIKLKFIKYRWIKCIVCLSLVLSVAMHCSRVVYALQLMAEWFVLCGRVIYDLASLVESPDGHIYLFKIVSQCMHPLATVINHILFTI